MGKIINVNLENFQTEVVDASMERAVVLDFWADWCGPCKQLGPLLEKLAHELDFTLAKVDTEANQELTAHFQISSIPDVRVVKEGRIVDGFQGVLPEDQIRETLTQYFMSPFEVALMKMVAMVEEGRNEEVLEPLNELCQAFPEQKKSQYWLARVLLNLKREEEADQLLNTFNEGDDFFREAKALLEMKAFTAALSITPENELDEFYVKGSQAAIEGKNEEALQNFLEIVKRDREYKEDVGRLSMITLFGVLGSKDELTLRYRKKLNMYLFS